ncbi:MAG: polysaccharide biosynthesis C-terminal domain-containing protein [Flavobacteriales bacterium]|nr:polysaccharide biosynthesis C-terminal domain-containing protein [Flavobacteriales bacterium]MCX7649355.1 polysaccharide biosynthesis C-terminal domain-containing protein [Flavobacteriales bacterium]MDW8432772.1 polysaccharide biosynthesis C-terminal domain-containing protein [Flavobacteriales bacterium]
MPLNIRQLASQTAVYGLSSIVARVLNYLLTPLLTGIFEPAVYAIINELYSYIAVVLAILTFGLETALFRFGGHVNDSKTVFTTALGVVAFLTLGFFLAVVTTAGPISEILRYPGHSDYVIMFSLIIALDALAALPQARLRQLNRPGYFALVNIANVGVSVGLILFWLVYCRQVYLEKGSESSPLVRTMYNHDVGVAYVFMSNIAASAVKLLLLLPVVLGSLARFSSSLLPRLLRYSWPLAVGSVCFIINEKADVLFLTHILPREEARHAVGVYAACYKLALLMYLFIQAFRFAAEPYFFSQARQQDAPFVYAGIMNWFVGFCLGIFLFINLYLDILKYFIAQPVYWEGLGIVPVITMAILLSGVYLNLSMWYKLSGETSYGMAFSIVGALVTVVLNVALIPSVGYWGSAWATLTCYAVMVAVSYYFGQKKFPIPYQMDRLGKLFLLAGGAYALFQIIPMHSALWVRYGLASVLMALYIIFAVPLISDKSLLHALARKN